MKKVAIIYKSLPQYRYEFFQILKKELEKCDIQFDLIYGKQKNTDSLKNDEVEIDWATYIPNKVINLGKNQLIWQPCLKYVRGADLVIVEQANRLLVNYYFSFFRRFRNYKFAYWGHGRNLQDHPDSMRNKFKYHMLKKCDWWFAYTETVRKMLNSYGFPQEKITVVQNAIDTRTLKNFYNETKPEEIAKLRELLGITGNNIGIYCGGMYKDKRLEFILDVCHEIKKAVTDFHMIFVGNGIDATIIQQASLKYDYIHYVGSKFGKERVKYFKLASIQLMPGAVGLGILDSFALQTPMITTNLPFHGPEIEYLENGVNGIITENNFEDYTQQVIELFKTEKYKELTESCVKHADVYTVEKMVENFKNGILQCLKD